MEFFQGGTGPGTSENRLGYLQLEMLGVDPRMSKGFADIGRQLRIGELPGLEIDRHHESVARGMIVLPGSELLATLA